ncbi:methylmalonyl-CoA mutase [Cohnella sp. CFH 77786]|uniref:fused isobutyryl-CoA mutase/GTPase IcmF n=1 Tax=Cohnella sp. CFH 77786 TaxID=2662265 RepID=UPI001C610656|nr:fused isobutyryl-CoA mutase/GTPase IcmF [Cohnella sp. CFH 77786]MBW5446390.1 methylmalonyl-CoA mutase [Cohnella sp. CFH 77786]
MTAADNRYRPLQPVRFVTASALFDGHDVSIQMIRRLLQASGAEVIHLGHNRSVDEVVRAAIQEDVQGIAVSSYQGGHMEFFRYLIDSLKAQGASEIRVFGGGGGVILPSEIAALHGYGVARIFSPHDGREIGLQGMIDVMLRACDYSTVDGFDPAAGPVDRSHPRRLAKAITLAENRVESVESVESDPDGSAAATDLAVRCPVVGITGTGGSGKSSLTDELVRRFLRHEPQRTIAVLSVDPTRHRTGGALLGDRIRMNAVHSDRVFMRSLATRGSGREVPTTIRNVINVVKQSGCDLILLETSGIGQGDYQILRISDVSLYVMTSDFGAPSQLEKIEMLDHADLIAVNKSDRRGSADALRDVKKQYQRNRGLMDRAWETMPVYATAASRFNDEGVDALFAALIDVLNRKLGLKWPLPDFKAVSRTRREVIIPAARSRYLGEIVHTVREYRSITHQQAQRASVLYRVTGAIDALRQEQGDSEHVEALNRLKEKYENELHETMREALAGWTELRNRYAEPRTASLSGLEIPKVSLPPFADWGDLVNWIRRENVPGAFPFTAGVFPFKRTDEEPKRQFAGEGAPERTNARFRYLSKNDSAKRLSTAFDSVTLYGADPDERPDIFGKIGESGVSVCTLDDMKKLYSGFDLCDPMTSVSMTINGPAPILLAMYMNVAIDGQLEKFARQRGRAPTREEAATIRAETQRKVRGTVQADILKEDQGQNTCIFSTDFALRMMGDIQEYFRDHGIRHYYSVSISGYHIAEAGANPVTQLAFTLANAFTYVEYYLSRGIAVDDFAPNLSFFFSNGLDPEYAVIGRVARRIWATVLKHRYGAGERSQKLKYHVQTSGRSLHAQEIQFNDIRTTLQALMALLDNCNSLHTNAYDEAITTPTEESVRRAMAIQLILTRELGLLKNENLLQGSFFVEELTDRVEDAVLQELERLDERGGVLGAMEFQYPRGKIQDESMLYEMRKHSGELPIVGVNTFLNPSAAAGAGDQIPVARATREEKEGQIRNLRAFQAAHREESPAALAKLQMTVLEGGNSFAELMETVKVASLGQITQALYEVGGKYRRNT